ncbi:dehydrodolichyl diphosphate synthetase [Gonapodya prolifera JEL478]|uniref:Alkyl transferase n=1 Tax=Gonapodya prolifera (strain JEL478) TaxID=1344416 RepID=A0A139AR68_GONPJ|nr:dehydrodolichyl diphosphate synthetase [Gonapodya prolifera JEL478]|eukprot:KXS19212.1 dehydrodolichyl diphosphate synthetase [Gonapodya prolifera JEL478]
MLNDFWGVLATHMRQACVHILRMGSVPRHVAFIMDGNRRYAKKYHMKTVLGHFKGFDTLEETLEWCLDLGVEWVTVFAFSIDNFKRSSEEVDGLMNLAKEKFELFTQEGQFIQKNGIRVRVLGDLELLPEDVRRAAKSAMEWTKTNRRANLNICIPYTARHELANAVEELLNDTALQGPDCLPFESSDVSERLFTAEAPPVDILVRTSGETRLSDFLLWQVCEKTTVHFIDCLWPEFSFSHMLPILLEFQTSKR